MPQPAKVIWARILIIGLVLGSIGLLAFADFRAAGILIAIDLLVVMFIRIRPIANGPGWYMVRKLWIDLATLTFLLLGVALFTLWVPHPG